MPEGKEFMAIYHKIDDTDLSVIKNCCGSRLFSKKRQTNKYRIRSGILDDAQTQKPSFHIFVGLNVSWDEITDNLKQFNEMPTGR